MPMRIRKQLPIPEFYGDPDNDRIWCNWDDCGNPSSYLHRVKLCHASAPYRHDRGRTCGACEVKTFCCEQHKDYWRRSHIPGQYGKLGAGVNAVWL